jgi:hypothetical protein
MTRKISHYGAEKVVLNELGEPMFRRCITHDGKGTKDVPISERGFVKQLDVQVLLKRSFFSEADYEQHTAFFVQKYRCKMPKDRDLEFVYFKYNPKTMGTVCIRNFDKRYAFNIAIHSKDDQKKYGIKKIGKAKKVSLEKAKAMLQNHEVLGLFNDRGENKVMV